MRLINKKEKHLNKTYSKVLNHYANIFYLKMQVENVALHFYFLGSGFIDYNSEKKSSVFT
jgi:hypothetical protein